MSADDVTFSIIGRFFHCGSDVAFSIVGPFFCRWSDVAFLIQLCKFPCGIPFQTYVHIFELIQQGAPHLVGTGTHRKGLVPLLLLLVATAQFSFVIFRRMILYVENEIFRDD